MQTPQDGGGVPAAEEPFDDLDQIDPGAESEDQELEDEPEEPSEPDEGAPTQPVPAAASRRPGRRERQSAELRSLREENERLRRDFEGFRSQQRPAGPDPAEQARRDQAEREHVATLDYGQQIQYWRDKDRREFEQRVGQTQLATAQQMDRLAWDAACRMDSVRAQFNDQVERLFQDEARAGRLQSREVLFQYIYGGEALRQRQNRTAGQRQAAARRVASQTTRPGGVRGDGGVRTRQPAGDSYEASLERLKGRALW